MLAAATDVEAGPSSGTDVAAGPSSGAGGELIDTVSTILSAAAFVPGLLVALHDVYDMVHSARTGDSHCAISFDLSYTSNEQNEGSRKRLQKLYRDLLIRGTMASFNSDMPLVLGGPVGGGPARGLGVVEREHMRAAAFLNAPGSFMR